jgi:Protein of unknown function (DUF3179)
MLIAGALAAVLGPAAPRGLAGAGDTPSFDTSEWRTNFSIRGVSLTEITSGGPRKDGIPAIDKPVFERPKAASAWLGPREPVILVAQGDDVRAYPLQILIWHEIVNDAVGGIPVAITFCPLCNTAIAFDRRAGGRTLDFGTTGKLRFSDLIMYDRQTESWWQQVIGEAIVGDLTGTRLRPLPAQIISWETFAATFPQGKVLSRATGYQRAYGRNPYVGYDNIDSSPFLYTGPRDPRLRPMERVVTVTIGSEDAAYPLSVLGTLRVINDALGGTAIVVLFEKGVASALDRADIAASRDVGTSAVFNRTVNGHVLTFHSAGDRITDAQTGSTWTILGTAVAGPLRGTQLTRIVSGQYFWFAWAAFKPHTRIYHP